MILLDVDAVDAILQEQGLTRADLSRKMGRQGNYMGIICNRARDRLGIRPQTALDIADALGVNMSDIASSHYTKSAGVGVGVRGATWYLDESKVRAILKSRGITFEQLGRMMYKSCSDVRVTLYSARAGRPFRLSTVRELADALHVDVTDIATERRGE